MTIELFSARRGSRSDRNCRDSDRGGYVLLVVIAASVLVVTVLGTLAKISMRRALDAADARRSLQQRWGALTLQRALLTKAPSIFEHRDKVLTKIDPDAVPLPYIRDALTFGGVTYDVLIGDEDSKLSLNALYHHVGKVKAEQAIGELVGDPVRRAIRLLPAAEPSSISRQQRTSSDSDDSDGDAVAEPPDAFRSWGEVLDIARLKALLASESAVANVTTGITCWGSGQLNIRRASDEAILAIIGSVVQDGGARRILQRYRQNSAATLPALLQLEVKNQRHRDRLSQMLTSSSTNFSLWISASSKHARRLTDFVVSRSDDEGVTRYSKFSF